MIINIFEKKKMLNNLVSLLIVTWIMILPFEIISYMTYLFKRKINWADVMWPAGFLFLNFAFYNETNKYAKLLADWTLAPDNNFYIKDLLFYLITIWAIRLFFHLLQRYNKFADNRYDQLTKNWSKLRQIQIFLKIFILQGLLTGIIILPALAGMTRLNDFRKPTVISYIFVILWLIGFLLESLADFQLAEFIEEKNKSKICVEGLWSICRHPNYLGELIMWWSIYLIVVTAYPDLWLTIISPLLITYLIIKKSGINLIDQEFAKNKAYQNYIKKTPALLPKIF
jgi:steroid 5-alpha reductase family enzyme